MQTPANPSHNDKLAEEIASLSRAPIVQLRDHWRAVFRTEPPSAFGPDLLRRSIAQRLQENAFGKLPSAAQRELDRIIDLLEKAPTAALKMPRRIKAGAVLVRDWKTESHRVTVLADGFAYDGHTYASLSEIAREITGTNWNGPRFFGLRPPPKKVGQEIMAGKRGRPAKQMTAAKSANSAEAGHGG